MGRLILKLVPAAIIFLLFTFVHSIFAQQRPQGGRPQGPPIPDSTQVVQMVDHLTEKVSLTDEQKTEMLNLHFKHFEELRLLVDSNKPQMDALREKHDAHRKKFEDAVQSILSDEQFKAFQKFMESNRPPRQGTRPGRNRGRPRRTPGA